MTQVQVTFKTFIIFHHYQGPNKRLNTINSETYLNTLKCFTSAKKILKVFNKLLINIEM